MYDQRPVYVILLAAGNGSRMHSETKKQFMKIQNLPLFLYSYNAFRENLYVDEILVITGKDDIPTIEKDLSDDTKFGGVVPGGKERYHSVYQGLYALERKMTLDLLNGKSQPSDPIVLIHDGARPCITDTIINDSIAGAARYQAATVGVPVKDTIKEVNEEGIVVNTPDRKYLYMVQTPQSFSFKLIFKAYSKLIAKEKAGTLLTSVTDDAQVLETFTEHKVRILPGDYRNIKITTPEDLPLAELYLHRNSAPA